MHLTVHLITAHMCPKLRMMRYDVSFPIHPVGEQSVPKIRLSASCFAVAHSWAAKPP